MVKMKSVYELVAGVWLNVIALSHWFPLEIYPLELIGAFAHFTLGLAILCAIVSVLFGYRMLTCFSSAASIICGILIFPHFFSSEFADSHDISIGQFNLYHNNPSPHKAIEAISLADADVFCIQELNSEWKSAVDSAFSTSHPFILEEYWDHCCYGLGIYSRLPISTVKKLYFENIPYFEVVILVDSQPIRVICFHTQAPAFPNMTSGRDQQMQAVAELVGGGRNTIMMGDLNIVPWDKKFRHFLHESGLTRVRGGFQATYPMDLGIPLIPIDHIAHTEGLVPASCDIVEVPGSDHRGLLASFAIKD
jgi:endonuclease/exonuclease/phosphatase (EEP) superfamily protein YafD